MRWYMLILLSFVVVDEPLWALDQKLLQQATDSANATLQVQALLKLRDESRKDSVTRAALEPLLKSIAHQDNHPNHWIALDLLWNWNMVTNASAEKIHLDLTPELLKIAQDSKNPHQFLAIQHLWYSGDNQQTVNRQELKKNLQEIAKNPHSPHAIDATNLLSVS